VVIGADESALSRSGKVQTKLIKMKRSFRSIKNQESDGSMCYIHSNVDETDKLKKQDSFVSLNANFASYKYSI
jgi:hypothetical protein